jgi:hypothetical protein
MIEIELEMLLIKTIVKFPLAVVIGLVVRGAVGTGVVNDWQE